MFVSCFHFIFKSWLHYRTLQPNCVLHAYGYQIHVWHLLCELPILKADTVIVCVLLLTENVLRLVKHVTVYNSLKVGSQSVLCIAHMISHLCYVHS